MVLAEGGIDCRYADWAGNSRAVRENLCGWNPRLSSRLESLYRSRVPNRTDNQRSEQTAIVLYRYLLVSLGRLRRSGWAAGDRGWIKTKSRNRWSWREHQLVHFTYVAMFIYVLYFSSLLHTMCFGCFFDSFGNKFVESKLAVWLFVAVPLLVVSVLYVKCTM